VLSLLLQQSSDGELQLLGNDYSASFADQIQTYLNGANSLPAFLSSVTLELFNRQTLLFS
jgi:mitotic spindle assembly checkpoint protein MAD1